MARRYSASATTSVSSTAPGQAYAEMLAGTEKPISVCQILVSTRTNVGGAISLARAYAVGTGAATGIATAVHHRIGATTSARLQVAWTSSGVTPTGYHSKIRQSLLPVATGQVLELWNSSSDGPLVIEPSGSLLLVNQGSGFQGSGLDGLLSVNVTWEEGHPTDR